MKYTRVELKLVATVHIGEDLKEGEVPAESIAKHTTEISQCRLACLLDNENPFENIYSSSANAIMAMFDVVPGRLAEASQALGTPSHQPGDVGGSSDDLKS